VFTMLRMTLSEIAWLLPGIVTTLVPIDALMEPTEGMMENEDEISLSAWRDMIRAAKEGK